MMPLLQIRDLHFSYRTPAGVVPVLRGISLDVQPGEMVALQGPSGSGKSTLLYFLGCLMRPDSGSVRFRGRDVGELSDEERAAFRNRSVGFVFQQFHLLPRATVVDNILLPARYPLERASGRLDRGKAEALARAVGLGDRLHHLPNQLSGGQQQRVAIARALMNDADLILADEPTGNLDSKQTDEILDLFQELNRQGKTVILITHDPAVAARCGRVLRVKDGCLEESELPPPARSLAVAAEAPRAKGSLLKGLLPLVWEGFTRQKGRALLTMSGITIGVAAVLAMVTLGEFSKRKILESYAELGVNTLVFHGSMNWDLKATDEVSVKFYGFDWERDLARLPEVFPEIDRLSPVTDDWNYAVNFGGKRLDNDIHVMGVGPDALAISGHKLSDGNPILPIHVQDKSNVCLIGSEIKAQLFGAIPPVGQVIRLTRDQTSYGCQVIGVLEPQTSNKEWRKPNLEIYTPYTQFQAISNQWNAQIRTVLIQARLGTDIERLSTALKAYFEQKYGKAGEFRASGDTKLLAQMKRFLTIFTFLLGAIALVSLGVGGIGITNLMLVSLSERLKEIGLRKALGATDRSVRAQFLAESAALCSFAGLIGLILGFALYEGAVYGASFLIPSFAFQWIVEPWAVALSFVSIVVVGLASGFVPALRAERLQVIEALRSE